MEAVDLLEDVGRLAVLGEDEGFGLGVAIRTGLAPDGRDWQTARGNEPGGGPREAGGQRSEMEALAGRHLCEESCQLALAMLWRLGSCRGFEGGC